MMSYKMQDQPKAFLMSVYGIDEARRSHLPDLRYRLYRHDGNVADSGMTKVYELAGSVDTKDSQIIFNLFTHTANIICVRGKLSLSGIL